MTLSIAQALGKMKGLSGRAIIGLIAVAASAGAGARAGEVRWGKPSLGGTACARQSITVDWDANRGRLQLALPPSFDSGTAKGTRRTCLISIPVQMPVGRSLAWKSVELERDGPAGSPGKARVSAQGNGEPPLRANWEGEALASKDLAADSESQIVGCGGSGLLRLNLSTFLDEGIPTAFKIVKFSAHLAQDPCNYLKSQGK